MVFLLGGSKPLVLNTREQERFTRGLLTTNTHYKKESQPYIIGGVREKSSMETSATAGMEGFTNASTSYIHGFTFSRET